MSRFLNQKYEELIPYTPGEQPKVTGRLIKLNTNENPYPPSPKVMEAINDVLCDQQRRRDCIRYLQSLQRSGEASKSRIWRIPGDGSEAAGRV